MSHRSPLPTIAVVGLGCVGLPLAVEFGKKYRTLGIDLTAEDVKSAYDAQRLRQAGLHVWRL